MRSESLDFLKDLLTIPSPGGYESAIQKRRCDCVRPFADEIHIDHSTVEMVDLRDVERTAARVAAFCTDLKSGEAFRVEV